MAFEVQRSGGIVYHTILQYTIGCEVGFSRICPSNIRCMSKTIRTSSLACLDDRVSTAYDTNSPAFGTPLSAPLASSALTDDPYAPHFRSSGMHVAILPTTARHVKQDGT